MIATLALLRNFAGALLLTFAGGDGEGEFIPLLSGEILVGEVSSHDEDGIEVKRLDNGGIVHLRWSQLAPPYERSLRAKLGYVFDSAEEVLVDADEITLPDGTKKVGRIVDQNATKLVLKDGRSSFTYERSRIAGQPARVRVPALDVYTKDELYNDKLATIDATTAQGNLDLARYLEQIQDFARALQHWNEVKKIDPNFHPGEVGVALKRVEENKARQDEFDYLREIEIAKVQRQWDKALAMCDEFAKKFPKSTPVTRADVEKRKKNITDLKTKQMVMRTYQEVYRVTERILYQKAADRKLSLAGARSYVENELDKLMVEAAAATLQKEFKEINEGELDKLWKVRGKLPSIRTVSYGMGTFTLGNDAARKGIDIGPGTTQGAGPTPDEVEMAKKLKRLLEKQTGGTAPGQQKKLEPPEDWWIRAHQFERYQFLLAYYVEFGGKGRFQIEKFMARHCIGCGGKGTISIENTGGGYAGGVSVGGRGGQQPQGNQGPTSAQCTTCHGSGFERIVTYR